ncbi:MAG: DUF3352 domain-containing protein [Pseudanabaenaceae cyanobacterium bins.39]|nr:DUF3352 domain-containing protein [Pseudanabaenaceae cyanobacterium bins.39]
MSKSSRDKQPKQKSKQQKQTTTLLYVGIGAAAIGTIAAGTYIYFSQRLQATKGILGAAAVVPEQAQVVIAFNTNPEPWKQLVQFGTPASQKLISNSIEKSPLNALLSQSQTDYDRDVKPWLDGYVLTALVPDPQQPQAPAATLIIAPTRDRQKSELFLNKYREALTQQGARFTSKQYKDFTYFESPSRDPNNNILTADIGGQYVAIATSANLLQQSIDTYKGNKASLAKKEAFAKIYNNPNQTQIASPLVHVYLDGDVALEFIGSQTKLNLNESAIAQSRKELAAITLAGGTQKEGIRIEINSFLKNDSTNVAANSESKILNFLPQETFLLISGLNLYQSWQSITNQAKGNASSAQLIEQVRKAVKDGTKLDLDRDILQWMDGEFAIAAIPNNKGILANPGFGFVAIAQTSKPNAAKSTLEKLDQVAQTSAGGLLPKGVEIKSTQIGNQSVTTWNIGNTTIATRGNINQDFVFWSMGNLVETFLPSPARNLPDSRPFQILTTGMPKANGGYFYFNMTSALAIADRLLPPEVKSNPSFTEVRDVLDAINGISVTTTTLNPKNTRLDFLFTLKPTPGN